MQVGQVIADRYRIDRMVRRGGLSVLVAARDELSGLPVALKIVTLDPHDEGIRQRLEREVAILRGIDHPRIVRCLDSGRLSALHVFLALEWLDGQDLADMMRQEPITLRTTLEVVEQVADALQASHRRGIIHRDIKPANIFVMASAGPLDCRVLDFGVAKIPSTADHITQTGAILGTPNYMAPEQASFAMSVDGRADLYSLGVVAFELIARRLPFTAGSDLARLARILTEDATPILEVVPELPPAAAELIDHLLVRDRGQRLQTAEDVRAVARATLDALDDDALDRVYPPVELEEVDSDRPAVAPFSTAPAVPALSARPLRDRSSDHPTPLELSNAFLDDTSDPGPSVDEASLDDQATAEQSGPIWSAGSVHDPVSVWAETVDELPSLASDFRFASDIEVTTPMFGRQELVDRASARLRSAVRGAQPTLQLFVGPGGIGKTRLSAAMVLRLAAEQRAPRVFAARAEEGRQRVPFDLARRLVWAIADVVPEDPPRIRTLKVLSLIPSHAAVERLIGQARPMLGSLEGGADATERERAVVAAFVAEALDLTYPAVTPVVAARRDPARASRLMVEALDLVLRALAEDGGLVVVVDDVHWLDDGSARVLRSLLAPDQASSVAVVGFGSPTLLDPDARAQWPLSGLGAQVETVVRLGSLSPVHGRALVEALLPAAANEADVDRVLRKTGGNVLYLEQLTKALVETGVWRALDGRMRWSDGIDAARYPTVAAAISARLGRRPSTTQRVITAAAAFGQVFWPQGVARLTELPLAQVTAELELLIRQRWIRPRSQSRYADHAEYEFVHGALQAVALARLKRVRREAFEAEVAAFLIEAGEREPAVIAPHRGAAGLPAAQTYLAAAERALKLGDTVSAAQMADDGLALSEDAGPIAPALRAILEAVALASGDWELGVEALDALERETADPTALIDLACRRCRLALNSQRFEDALAAAERAAAIVADAGVTGPWAAQVELHQAEVAERAGQGRTAGRLFAAARRVFEELPAWTDAFGSATAGLARGALRIADYATADARFRAAVVHARMRHNADQLVDAYEGLFEVACQTGDVRRARALAAEILRADFSEARSARAHMLRGRLAAEAGRWAEAQDLIEESAASAAGIDDQLWMRALVGLGQIYRLPPEMTSGVFRGRQRLSEHLAALDEATETAERLWPLWQGAIALARAMAASLIHQPDPSAADLAVRCFENEGLMIGDEPAGAAFGLARLSALGEDYAGSGRAYLRRAVRLVDEVLDRLGADQRQLYLNRPSVAAIVMDAHRMNIVAIPDGPPFRFNLV